MVVMEAGSRFGTSPTAASLSVIVWSSPASQRAGLIVDRVAGELGSGEQFNSQLDRLGNALRHLAQPD